MEQVHIIASLTSSVFSFQKDKVITADELEVKHYQKTFNLWEHCISKKYCVLTSFPVHVPIS